MVVTLRFRSCRLHTWPSARHTRTQYPDGAVLHAADNDEQVHAAQRCGYDVATNPGEAVYRYTRDHEALHHLRAEAIGLPCSPTLWYVAHGGTKTLREHTDEEAEVCALHSLLRRGVAHEQEFSDGLAMAVKTAGEHWPGMLRKGREVLRLLEGFDCDLEVWGGGIESLGTAA